MRAETYRRMLNRLEREADEEEFVIDAERLSRYDVMALVVKRIAEGETLMEICFGPDPDNKTFTGLPHPKTVYQWMNNHPDFKLAFEQAEQVGAHLMSDRALRIATRSKDKDEVPAAKLAYEALTSRASKMSAKFVDKQIIKREDSYIESMPEDKLKLRLLNKLNTLGIHAEDLRRNMAVNNDHDPSVVDADIEDPGGHHEG